MNKISNIRFHFFISGKLQTFEEYAEYIESSLRSELYKFDEAFREESDEDKEEFIHFHYDEMAQFRDNFPAIMRNSLFISVYSFLEEKIIELCNQPDETGIKLDDLQGNGIQRASLFIKKVMKKDFPDDTKEWHFIMNANQIRNCIVHCGGDIDKTKSPTKVRNAVNELKNVTESRHSSIVLNEEFCLEFIKVVEKFLRKLYKIGDGVECRELDN
ncbi:hypothetical protein [Bacillus swezeyi]|uniref:hypothetical protein n=1 Tax=Bacillus swezeyi TaxID=1925020 RepID=UPI0027DADBB4|nr:hypothetical protein [Bacillus swezeyi]